MVKHNQPTALQWYLEHELELEQWVRRLVLVYVLHFILTPTA